MDIICGKGQKLSKNKVNPPSSSPNNPEVEKEESKIVSPDKEAKTESEDKENKSPNMNSVKSKLMSSKGPSPRQNPEPSQQSRRPTPFPLLRPTKSFSKNLNSSERKFNDKIQEYFKIEEE